MKLTTIFTTLISLINCISSEIQFPTETPEEISDKENYLKLISSINNFAFTLHWYLPETGNLLISPLSLCTALAMLYYGARNQTEKEMAKVLGYEHLRMESKNVHRTFQTLLKNTNNNNSKHDLVTANAVLLQKDFPVLSNYKSDIEEFYNATVQEVDFAREGEIVVKMINAWTAWKTQNKVEELISEPLSSLTALFLLNAVYFKGVWKTKFDQRITTPDTFYNNGHIPKTVPMMRLKTKLLFGIDQDLKVSALELPYDGEELAMIILLPFERDGLKDLEGSISASVLSNISSILRKKAVHVTLPRFKLNNKYELTEQLRKMGIQSLFDPSEADLTGISKKEGIYATTVVHNAVLDVNEQGVEAASVSGIAAGVRIGQPLTNYFTADHPFLIFIHDSRTRLIYFMARVNEL
ncbi:leukocyte elastase inhibitor C-like [Centruroides sculpturatus]|uniref:leukocyte elastase inhibitor C-like n=1 Tax=Centruroides sculpturatus TaxID=218467 RepID=UPI000C6EE9CE|nr:leukocyte elastase inhibitor C-like [Centruroides sculpturatus]XP_023216503.1 leukocyte elastase inhibitor C-like [Centruroides sculpturatus]XP_023216504.1 leukocyte elastase inhibitor C-like [Centruroides sculpturatus]XP_023216505.1 leukocyte elastase inhibitor C-like [Centruroides sculpturatus]XP_023216506.1 leukocyte elastase inhibitor C-like [Centruroides sculpturatus]XP_023216507.1 leukocyte elastase inhibitor C-like [Centruroides sculpturatus]XP_023216508.1 leukocyte elastase inhibit